MSIREFIDYINNKNNSNKDSELIQLYKNPVPEKKNQTPITQVFKKIFIIKLIYYLCLKIIILNIY